MFADWAQVESYVNDDTAEILDILARAIELHRQVGDDFALAADLIMATEVNDEAGNPEAVDACIGEARKILESHPPSADLAVAIGRQAFVALRRSQAAEARDLADISLSLADDLQIEAAAFNPLNAKGLLLTVWDGDPSGLDLLEEARRRAQNTGETVEEGRAQINMAIACLLRQEFELAIGFSERALERARSHNLPIEERVASGILASTLLFAGEWNRAEELVGEELLKPYSKLVTPTAQHVMALLAIRRGRANASAMMDDAWTEVQKSDDPSHAAHPAAAQAEVMWIKGTLDADLAETLREVVVKDPWDGEISFWLWMAGDRSVKTSGVPEPYRLAMEGDAHQASELWLEKGMPYERAVSLVLCDGPASLEGVELLEALGAHATASRCRQLLRSRGVSLPRGRAQETREHPTGLTTRQDEVL